MLRDDGADTVVKGDGKLYWAHRASLVALPKQGVPLDAVQLTDASSHDSQSLVAHLRRLDAQQPEWLEAADFLLDDSAAEDADLRALIQEEFGLTLRTSVPPPAVEGFSRRRCPGGGPS